MKSQIFSESPDPRVALLLRTTSRAIDVFIFSWLFISTGALFPLLVSGGTANFNEDSAAMLRLLLVPSVVIAPVLIWSEPRRLLSLLGDNVLIVMLLVWIWLSVVWSIDPPTSLRRAILLTANSVIACYLLISYDLPNIIRMLFWVCLLQLILCLAFAVLLPDLAFMPNENRLRGIFTHKSVLGQFLVVATFIFILTFQEELVHRWLSALGLCLVVVLLIPSRSATALLLISMLIAATAAFRVFRLKLGLASLFLFCGLSLIGASALVCILSYGSLIELLGRDATLTGRTGIWDLMLGHIWERPVLGYGYRAFFEDANYGAYIKEVFLFDLSGSHNGFIEMWLDTGIVGLLLAMSLLLSATFRSVRRLPGGRNLAARFSSLWLLVYIGRNIVESDLVSHSHMSWTLVLLAVTAPGWTSMSNTGEQ